MIYFLTFFILIVLIGSCEYSIKLSNSENLLTNRQLGKSSLLRIILLYLLIVSFIALWLIGALRKDVGIDYQTYSILQIPRVLSGELDAVEPLSSLIFILGDKLGSYQHIFSIIQIIIVFFSIKAIYDQSKNYTLSFLLLFLTGYFNTSLNLMRQCITIAIFLYSLKYIKERKLIKYCFWILIAFLFHKTAILYAPIYFIYNIKFTRIRAVIFLLLTAISSLFFDSILYKITQYFQIYTNYWGSTEMGQRIDAKFSGSYWVLNILVMLIMLFIYYNAKINDLKLSRELDFYLYLQLICIGIMIIAFNAYVPNFDRILTMFSYTQIIAIPAFFNLKINSLVKKTLLFLLIGVYLIIFIRLFIISNIGGTFPYQSIF